MPGPEPARSKTLADKLERLFRTMHPRSRGEYSYEEVADGIRAKGGPTISATYLWQLRKGLRDNPTKHHLEALATFFGITPAYFMDESTVERIDAELDLIAALRDGPVRHIALRAFGLSPESLQAIADIIENVRKLEGLPEPDAPRPRRGRPPRQPAPDQEE